MIPASHLFDQSIITALLAHDPVVCDYRALFTLLDWSVVDQWQAARSPRGRPAHPQSAYLWEAGALMRVTLDRDGPLFHAVYTQRTSCERIDSQAKELGIEHPKVRNGRSVANLNTLIYLIINVRALQRARFINTGLLSIQKGFLQMN